MIGCDSNVYLLKTSMHYMFGWKQINTGDRHEVVIKDIDVMHIYQDF